MLIAFWKTTEIRCFNCVIDHSSISKSSVQINILQTGYWFSSSFRLNPPSHSPQSPAAALPLSPRIKAAPRRRARPPFSGHLPHTHQLRHRKLQPLTGVRMGSNLIVSASGSQSSCFCSICSPLVMRDTQEPSAGISVAIRVRLPVKSGSSPIRMGAFSY